MEKLVILTAKDLVLSVIDREIIIKLSGLEKHAGLAPNHYLAMRLTPKQSRQFAEALNKLANKAEE